jgi:hypothetical protein
LERLSHDFPVFRCLCDVGMCGTECNLDDPCSRPDVCLNSGVCSENCGEYEDYICNCTEGFIGKNCTEVVSLRTTSTKGFAFLLFNPHSMEFVANFYIANFCFFLYKPKILCRWPWQSTIFQKITLLFRCALWS